MRHVLFYISSLLFFHTLPPLIAARPALAHLLLPPHLMMYVSAAVMVIFVLRGTWVMHYATLVATLSLLSLGAILISFNDALTASAGLLLIGACVPILVRYAFEDASFRERPIGQMLGLASFALESLALSVGLLVTYVSVDVAQTALFILPLLILLSSLYLRDPVIEGKNAQGIAMIDALKDVVPAVCANTAFFLFLSAISLTGKEISPLQIGAAIAVTAIGFAGGAFLSDRIRNFMPDRLLLIVFSAFGLTGGLIGTMVPLDAFPGLIFLIAICISSSNGVIISTSLASKRALTDPKATLPADNALVFLGVSAIVALIVSLGVSKYLASTWPPIVVVYTAAIISTLVGHQRLPRERQ